jgi:hypothetical protein
MWSQCNTKVTVKNNCDHMLFYKRFPIFPSCTVTLKADGFYMSEKGAFLDEQNFLEVLDYDPYTNEYTNEYTNDEPDELINNRFEILDL